MLCSNHKGRLHMTGGSAGKRNDELRNQNDE